jgi:Domain of unknown function (DUF377).
MDKNDPAKVLQRMDTWFMKPDKPYETTGQVNHVCFERDWHSSTTNGFYTTAQPIQKSRWR